MTTVWQLLHAQAGQLHTFPAAETLRQSPDSVLHVICSLCKKRPAKRACPALRHDICTVCCATKRLVEIHCTEDCRYLESAQRHPAAVIKRQIDADVTVLMASIGPLSEQQLQLFFLLQSMVLSYKPEALSALSVPSTFALGATVDRSVARLTDEDVALAAGALAGSLETASKGLIFEESTGSVVAEGLRRALKPVIDEVTKNGGSRVEREVALVLRGLERGAKHEGGHIPPGDTSYLEIVARVFQQRPPSPLGGSGGTRPPEPLIILP